MEIRTPEELEQHTAAVARGSPPPAECVLCFVERTLGACGCDGTLRWARRWRDLRLPRVTGLERRLQARGGCCDCEAFLGGRTVREDLQGPGEDGEAAWPAVRPPCAGVGSAPPGRAPTGSRGDVAAGDDRQDGGVVVATADPASAVDAGRGTS